MKKRLFGILCAGILVLGLWGCGRETGVTFEGHPSSPYLTALARGDYYLEMSMLYDGVIVSNSLAMKDGAIESRSQVGDSVSHTLRLKDTTYFLDDENRVYFAASAFGDDGLRGSIDYAAAEYIGSGRDTLLTGSEYAYDEYTCRTYENYVCTLRLYTDEEGNLRAIVNSDGTVSYEQDIAVFSQTVPKDWLRIPKEYTLVEEETYFNDYYGR